MPRRFRDISVKLGENPKSLTEDEITALRTECFEALGSDVDKSESDSSGSENGTAASRKQYPEQTFALQPPHRVKKKANPYAVNMEIPQGRHVHRGHVRGHGLGHNTLYQRQQMYHINRAQQNLLHPDSFVNNRQYSPLNLSSNSPSSAFVPVRRGGSVASSASSFSYGESSYTGSLTPSPSSDKSGPLPGISSFVTSTPVQGNFELDPHLFDTSPGHGYSAEELENTNNELKRQVAEEEQKYKEAVVEDMSSSSTTTPTPANLDPAEVPSLHFQLDDQSNVNTQTTPRQKDTATDTPLEVDGSSNGDNTSITSNFYINFIIFGPSRCTNVSITTIFHSHFTSYVTFDTKLFPNHRLFVTVPLQIFLHLCFFSPEPTATTPGPEITKTDVKTNTTSALIPASAIKKENAEGALQLNKAYKLHNKDDSDAEKMRIRQMYLEGIFLNQC